MDAMYTGQRILELRKGKGMTQKNLAEKLNVTDKAVSKWERGLNFPDLSVLERLAEELDSSVVELLGLEDSTNEKVALGITELAQQERIAIVREIINRGWLTVIFGALVLCGMIYASRIMADNNLFGMPHAATGGMSGFIGIIIANGMVSIWKGKKLLL